MIKSIWSASLGLLFPDSSLRLASIGLLGVEQHGGYAGINTAKIKAEEEEIIAVIQSFLHLRNPRGRI